jgi:hypothetical protein
MTTQLVSTGTGGNWKDSLGVLMTRHMEASERRHSVLPTTLAAWLEFVGPRGGHEASEQQSKVHPLDDNHEAVYANNEL